MACLEHTILTIPSSRATQYYNLPGGIAMSIDFVCMRSSKTLPTIRATRLSTFVDHACSHTIASACIPTLDTMSPLSSRQQGSCTFVNEWTRHAIDVTRNQEICLLRRAWSIHSVA